MHIVRSGLELFPPGPALFYNIIYKIMLKEGTGHFPPSLMLYTPLLSLFFII